MAGDCTIFVDGEPFSRQVAVDRVQAMIDADARLRAPDVGSVYAPLLNDRATLTDMDKALHEPPYKLPPQAPILYIKPRNTLAGPGAHVAVPNTAPGVRIGGSLGIVIGRTATRVTAEQALDHVAGFTVVADLCVPHESLYRLPLNCQARDGFCVVGPVVVPAAAVPDPDALPISIQVDGVERLSGHTGGTVRGVRQLLADVSEFMTLVPGDVLTLGVLKGSPVAQSGAAVSIRIGDWPALNFDLVAEPVVEEMS